MAFEFYRCNCYMEDIYQVLYPVFQSNLLLIMPHMAPASADASLLTPPSHGQAPLGLNGDVSTIVYSSQLSFKTVAAYTLTSLLAKKN